MLFTKNEYNQTKNYEMGKTCSVHGAITNAYKILITNHAGKRQVGGPRRTSEDNAKTDLRKNF